MNEIAKTDAQEIMEAVLIKGDLSKLTPEERNLYYSETCKSLGLNPLTKPFDYLQLGGKLIMYAKRDAADQLRKIHGVNIEVLKQEAFEGLFCVTVRAVDKTGRIDEDMGCVVMPTTGAAEIRANSILKAITKAKRRVTLSICGLGFLDETEIEDIPSDQKRVAPRKTQQVSAAPAASSSFANIPEGGAADPVEQYCRDWEIKILNAVDPKKLAKEWNDDRKNRETIPFEQSELMGLKDKVLAAVEFLKKGQ